MNEDSKFAVILSTPIGVVAMSIQELREALDTADNVLERLEISKKADDEIRSTKLMDARTIAQLFGMDATWFLTRARDNRLPHVRLGKFVRFDPIEIREFFHRNVK